MTLSALEHVNAFFERLRSRHRDKALQSLAEIHGQERSVEIVNDARRFVRWACQYDPDLKRWLEETGAGNDPELIFQLSRLGARYR